MANGNHINASGYNGQYHGSPFIPAITDLARTRIIATYEECGLLPQLAQTDYEGDLACADSAMFMMEPTIVVEPEFPQDNEEPRIIQPHFEYGEVRICQYGDFQIKISERDIHNMCSNFSRWEQMVKKALDRSILFGENGIEPYVLQKTIAQVSHEHSGNNAGRNRNIDLGSNSSPYLLSSGGEFDVKKVRKLWQNISQVAMEANWNCNMVESVAVVSPRVFQSIVAAHGDLNTCCGNNNVMYTGAYELPMYGFKVMVSNQLPTVMVGGQLQEYILVLDKSQLAFAHDMIQYKWWEGKFDRFLVGQWKYDSHLFNKKGAILATVAL